MTSFAVKIYRPAGLESQTPLPVCILLHGDKVGPESLNLLKKSLIRAQMMVVVLDIDTLSLTGAIAQLNVTLNYLLTRHNLDATKIGVFGRLAGMAIRRTGSPAFQARNVLQPL